MEQCVTGILFLQRGLFLLFISVLGYMNGTVDSHE